MRRDRIFLDVLVNGNFYKKDIKVEKMLIDNHFFNFGSFYQQKDSTDGEIKYTPQNNTYAMFGGYIDEIRVYRKQLIREEIWQNMAYPSCPFFCTNCEILAEDLSY